MTEKTKSYSHDEFANRLAQLLFISFVIAAAICIFYYYHFSGAISQEHKTWAEFGDFVGGTVGTLVSFFALFALLLTISLQSKALRVSQQELKLTREEAAKASAAAQAQVEHFNGQGKIDDIVASIRELERNIESRGEQMLVAYHVLNSNVTLVPLRYFLEKNATVVAKYQPGYPPPEEAKVGGNRHEELGQIFKLLFEQIMSLKDLYGAENRYKIFIHKHLELFFYLGEISALPFDWTTPLDKESKEFMKIFEDAMRSNRILVNRQLKKE
ncbi:hypothetical protein [Marinobacter lipolyticus]|uniref:hypothetical protein n=1 Tax=Marinobacter lipolyticus TaxID=209639 RepID=UPI003A8F98CA